MSKHQNQTTKEDLVRLIKVWKECPTLQDVVRATGRKIYWVSAMISRLRKAGVDLPKKHRSSVSTLTPMIDEIMSEIKNGKIRLS